MDCVASIYSMIIYNYIYIYIYIYIYKIYLFIIVIFFFFFFSNRDVHLVTHYEFLN